MKLIKVKEPEVEDIWMCPRCYHDYCGYCVDFTEVNFDIEDKPEGCNREVVKWKGISVCPWCYNQLIDKKLHPI